MKICDFYTKFFIVSFIVYSSLFTHSLFCNPSRAQIISGKASLSREGKSLIITQGSHKTIINWQDFSISSGEITKFIQPSELAAVLNRVISTNPSKIYGDLHANGKVYLINQNGIIIGPSGVIRANEFVGSTLDVSDAEFLGDKDKHFSGEKDSSFMNQGSIETKGDVLLFSREIDNQGNIVSQGDTYLGASTQVILYDRLHDRIMIEADTEGALSNEGSIKAVQVQLKAAGGNVRSFAINQEGLIEASDIIEKEGRIILSAEEGKVAVSGTLDVSNENEKGGSIHVLGDHIWIKDQALLDATGINGGGEILIGGDYQGKNSEIKNAQAVVGQEDVCIDASSRTFGNGGKVILWAEDYTAFLGSIFVQGGLESGDGGFVEVSGKKNLNFQGRVNALAPHGKTGELLLDPYNVEITGVTANGSFDGGNPNIFTPSGTPCTVDAGTIVSNLASSAVTIRTSGGGGIEDGTLTVSSTISWSSANKLTLLADASIIIDAAISSTYNSGSFIAMDFQGGLTPVVGGNYAGIDINGVAVSTIDGNITLWGTASDSGAAAYSKKGVIIRNSGGAVSSTGLGNITVTGIGALTTANNAEGVTLNNGFIESSGSGNITITGTSNGNLGSGSSSGMFMTGSSGYVKSTGSGNITINATGANTTALNCHGIEMVSNSYLSVTNSNLSVTGTAQGTGANGILLTDDRIESLGSGSITLIGTGAGAGKEGIKLSNGKPVGGGSDTGVITLEADLITFDPTNILTTGALIIRPKTAITMGLGDLSVGTLSFTTAQINSLIAGSFSSITFGSTTTGAVDVQALTFTQPITIIGSGITLNGNFAAGANNINFTSDTIDISGFTLTGTANLTLQPITPALSIGLLGGAGAYNLTQTELDNITDGFSQIVIGRNDGAHTITVGTGAVSYTFKDPLTLRGDAITIDKPLNFGSNDFDCEIGLTNDGTFTMNATKTVTTSGSFAASGNSNNDTFNIYVSGGQEIHISGGGGTNTLRGPDAANAWNITGNNDGNIGGASAIQFTGIHKLVGGTVNDIFTFFGPYRINGTPAIDGNGGTNTLIGPDTTNAWTITADDAGTIFSSGASGSTSFTDIQNLEGGSGNDTFTFNGSFKITGTSGIDGKAGNNTIVGPLAVTTWNITGSDLGNFNPAAVGATTFSNINNLTGGGGNDTFKFSTNGSLSGSIDGGVGSNIIDTLNMLASDFPIISVVGGAGTIVVGGFSNIQTVTGGAAMETLVAWNVDNTWSITNNDTGSVSRAGPAETISFSGIENLQGGSATNTFTFTGPFRITGSTGIDGNSGTNTLIGPNVDNSWEITDNNKGTVFPSTAPAATNFVNIQSLTGGTQDDTFVLANGKGLTGALDGGSAAPANNTLDYSAYTTAVSVDIAAGTATNIDGGISNIQTVIIPTIPTATSLVQAEASAYMQDLFIVYDLKNPDKLFDSLIIYDNKLMKIKEIISSQVLRVFEPIYFSRVFQEIKKEEEIEKSSSM